MKKPTYKHPLVVEKRNDVWYAYYSDDSYPTRSFAEGSYERGNYFMTDLFFSLKYAKEWMLGFFEWFKGVRL